MDINFYNDLDKAKSTFTGNNRIIFGNGFKMQFDTCKVTYTNPNILSYSGNFPVAFSANPHMFASVLSQDNSFKELSMNVKVNPGKDGFILRLQSTRGDFGSGDAYGVTWLAIGV